MRVARSPAWLEFVSNHPRVRPYIGPGTERASFGPYWGRVIGLEWPEGGVVFLRELGTIYSAHLVFLPKTKDAAGKFQQALTYLFTNTDCQKVIGRTNARWRHVRRTAEAAGLKHIKDEGGESFYELTRQAWTLGA